MNGDSTFLEIPQACAQAADWLIQRLRQGGMDVVRTFDLQSTRHYQDSCQCPQHGTQPCDCQMVVLFVYLAGKGSLSILAHGHSNLTWFSLVDSPQQRINPYLKAYIHRLVTGDVFQSIASTEDSWTE